jgi:GET complex subunit GET2
MLLALVLPHLPPPLPLIIDNSLKYMQMGSLFLDDLAGLVVGIGFIIYFSSWFLQS